MADLQLILASRSPRRTQLLREHGFDHVQADPPLDDPASPQAQGSQSPIELAMALAAAKVESLQQAALEGRPGAGIWQTQRPAGPLPDGYRGGGTPGPDAGDDVVILAADTLIVHHDGALAGTPETPQQARDMIARFVGRRHAVITGVATWSARGGLQCLADSAWVDVGDLADQQIEQYLHTGQWQGKAGGYNLFDRQAAGWPITVHGDPTTVVGLPMRLLVPHLARLGLFPRQQETRQ